jgi:alpha/beta superfamily hydrolase
MEVVIDHPAETPAPRGLALVAHPHPLFGGTLDNKVAQTLARTYTELGYIAIRPNFRGVGASEGEHDHGDGETDDLVRVAGWAQERFGALPIALAGFSFGAYVQTRVAPRIKAERLVLVGVPDGLVTGGRTYKTENVPADTIVIHGELDETAPLANALDWARPQDLPVVVVPGADHFFHRRLHILRAIIKGQWH